MTAKKQTTHPQQQQDSTGSAQFGDTNQISIERLEAEASAVDNEAAAAEDIYDDAGTKDEPEAQVFEDSQSALLTSYYFVGLAFDQVRLLWPEASPVLTDENREIGAQKFAPLLLKYQTPAIPAWLAKLIDEWRYEIYFGMWLAGMTYGCYQQVNKARREDTKEKDQAA